ncbi:MAG: COX15/CtaA family protein [Cocleimonas sp.]|nr:COX15/CtaA family protein [Cocleimonas sp.]
MSDAGLGCPDWPGCYGQLSVPDKVESNEFERPLEHGKAWKEMIHRYVAGTLGLLILAILFMVIKGLPKIKQSLGLPLLLLATVIFQVLLGMWTVTLLLSPMIVTAHLMGGMTTLSLLWWLFLNQKKSVKPRSYVVMSGLKMAAAIGLFFVVVQIFLGGWTSSNYAAVACGVDFPTCASQWWPKMDFANGFELSHKPDVNYEFGVLDSPARMAIQMVHRIGALVVFIYLIGLALSLLKYYKGLAIFLSVVLFLQVSLGIMNVVFALPLLIAVLHNLVAALLLLTVIAINHKLFKP